MSDRTRHLAHMILAGLLWCATCGGDAAGAVANDSSSNRAGGDDANDKSKIAFFEKHIRPLLVDRCHDCHAATAKRVRGGLLLDSRQGWERGGDSGPAVTPGDVEMSLLIKAVRYVDSDMQMPPKGKLSAREIGLLEKWVAMGAPDPRVAGGAVAESQTVDVEAGRRHWAYQPIADPQSPGVKNGKWASSPLDAFILAKLEPAGIHPAEPADKRKLIRRVTFDLIGLPPTPQEIDAFVDDDSPQAFERVVDRLLASPRYGERWGRHWLDVARYADSNGLDENIAHGNAWRYRDYVIAAFNDDKPFNQFVLEQIAGDLLPADEAESVQDRYGRLIATSFLSLGPKVLAEVDEKKMEMDIIDEQIDTLGKTFLATTLGCARCHDHKFDPITMEDYYALAGIFQSTRTMEHFTKIARWWENPIPTPAELTAKKEYEAKLAAQKSAIAALAEKANAAILEHQGPGGALPAKPEEQYDNEAKAALKKLRDEVAALEKSPPVLSSAMGVTEGKVVDAAVCLRGNHLKRGDVVARRFPRVLAGDDQPTIGKDRSGRLELARWLVSETNPLTARVMVNRVWRWHFGKGLVATVDNFGRLGERPTHPELLDWLARRFMEDNWSLKALHRRIVLSATYRMSSEYDSEAAAIDPTNRLHWRAEVHRLEAEEIRDALLAVSGRLDLTMGGPVLHVANREFIFNHTSKDDTTYGSLRRSVYLPVIRNHVYDALALFDFPDSAVVQGDRPTTTVAPQALLAMNGPLTWDAAAALAKVTIKDFENDKQRIDGLYERVYGRTPSPDELKTAQQFLQAFEATAESDAAKQELAWQALCQALLASNEFIYVR